MDRDALERYRRLGPFSLDELVDAANAVLRHKGAEPLSRRTVRYYIVEDLVPQAEGPPKYARYTFDHLVAVVAVRALQDEGFTLEQIRQEMKRMRVPGGIAHRANAWLRDPEPSRRSPEYWSRRGMNDRVDADTPARLAPRPPPRVEEPAATAAAAGAADGVGHPVRRIQLTPDLTLELREGADLKTALRVAVNKLIEIMSGRT